VLYLVQEKKDLKILLIALPIRGRVFEFNPKVAAVDIGLGTAASGPCGANIVWLLPNT
jgi:hypothetical protein